ncbi:Holliday junction branch migration protein RuvA [Pseudomonadales bacterium]|jgi:Holliday junction DNA helicase RuvA|nr:Holliday junction branch migration protein RuvA [Pseudomonadales bacterium]MDB4420799.1 Holliday junction branch migration protein RuvA [Pseudomonadales bacterium]MDB4542095.1 Holliday junction branch migration protein RuvA [Pseudomonadales bacterium]MDB4631331.1 Holliday junction branch migration protein RuvA [Pseudomonadales bacterium]
MISFLVGELVVKSAPALVLDVNGVGYEVQASLTTFATLPALGARVKLLTHFVVREDAQLLYGFADHAERKLFCALIKVNGVGPKLALAILSGMDVRGFARCILANDLKSLTCLPGVGKKTAERLVIEMKDRMHDWQAGDVSDHELDTADDNRSGGGHNILVAEAETALIALGYKPVEASKAIAQLDFDQLNTAEDAIRAALQATLRR